MVTTVKKKPSRKRAEGKLLLGEDNLSAIESEMDPGVDIETSGLSPWRDKIAVVSISSPSTGIHLIIHNRGKMSQRLRTFLGTRKRLTLHNGAGFDLLFMNQVGVDVFGPKIYDTMLSELALLTTDRRDVSVNLKSTMYRRTGKKISKDADHAGWMNPKLTTAQVSYCVDDIKELINLREAQLQRADDGQKNAIQVENDLIPVLVKMSTNGIPLDHKRLEAYMGDQKEVIKRLKGKLSKMLGPINFNSPIQLKKALVEYNPGWELKSTGKEVLQDAVMFGGKFGDTCSEILELRHATKRVDMYDKDWLDKHVIDGVVHPRFWSCSTDTGRMSSSDPNFQQIPADMREVFGGRPGFKMVWADLSQIEVRVAASVANCPGLRAAFDKGLHVHTDIASRSFRIPYDKVDDTYKRLAKGLTFTMLFGGAWETFQIHARRAGVDLTDKECQKIFADFFSAYPGMANLKKKSTALCREYRYRNKPLILRLPTGLKRVLMGWKLAPSKVMNCVDDKTEALTKRGWVGGFDLTKDDELLTKNPQTGILEWQKPTDVKLWPDYYGELYKFKSKSFNALTTPDHRWLISRHENWRDIKGVTMEKTSATLSLDSADRIHRTGLYVGSKNYSDDFVALVGWFVTDGHYSKKKGRVILSQTVGRNSWKVELIDQLLGRIKDSMSARYHYPNTSAQVNWVLSPQISDKLHVLFPERTLVTEFLHSLTGEQAKVLVQTMLLGDGSISSAGQRSFCAGKTSQSEKSDMFQFAAVLAGIASTASIRDMSKYHPKSAKLKNIPEMGSYYNVNLLSRTRVHIYPQHVRKYVGRAAMWCPIVPNTFFVVRRSGTTYITGNTLIQGGAAAGLKYAMLETHRRGMTEYMCASVHDELLGCVPDKMAQEYSEELIECMNFGMEQIMDVPSAAVAKVNNYWGK